jgi:hypothetical protein
VAQQRPAAERRRHMVIIGIIYDVS